MDGENDERAPGTPTGAATMQIDALVDDMEELPGEEEPAFRGSGPPPLPPKRVNKAVWIVGIFVILLASGLGVGFGILVFGGAKRPPPAVVRTAPAHPPPAPAKAPAAEPPDVVQMDEVVFDVEESAPPAAP
jgi:hypothetical protein